MANYATLKAAIKQVVKTNGNNEITGALLQQSLLSMINSLGAGYQFMGEAKPYLSPGTVDQKVFYIAGPGTYPNYGNIVVNDDEVAFLVWSDSWTKITSDIVPIQLTGSLGNDTLLSGVIFPAASDTVRTIILQSGQAPINDTLVSLCWETNATPISRISFYSDTEYHEIVSYDITHQGQVVNFPAQTKVISLRFAAGNTYLKYSLVSGTIASKIKEIEAVNNDTIKHLNTVDDRAFKKFSDVAELQINDSELYKGAVSLTDGSYFNHPNRICTDFIFVGNGLGIDFMTFALTQSVAYVRMFVVAYKDYYGERVFSRVISNGVYNGAVCHLHDDEDCVRMYCDFLNSSFQVIANPNISLFNEHVKIYLQEYVRLQQSNIIDVGNSLKLNSENVAWLFGDYSNFDEKKRTISGYLSIKEGHRYMVTAKSVGMISAIIFVLFDKDMNKTDVVVGYNSGTPIYNAVIDVPKGKCYLNVSVVLTQTISQRFNLDDYNIMIYDTTLDGVRFATKELSYIRSAERYAQGADINSGYFFQAYSNGTIDVYRLADKSYIQTLNMPVAIGGGTRHLGVIKFGGKYNENDRFGLLWLGGETGVANTVAVRITGEDGNMSCTVVYDLGDNAFTGDVLGFDFDNLKIFRSSYTTQPTPGQYQSSVGYPYVYEYNITEWNSSGSQTLIKSFDINDCYAIQMMQPAGNILYSPVGVGTRTINLFLINRITETIEQIVDMTQFGIPVEEPQCAFFNEGKLYLATVNGLWCLNI